MKATVQIPLDEYEKMQENINDLYRLNRKYVAAMIEALCLLYDKYHIDIYHLLLELGNDVSRAKELTDYVVVQVQYNKEDHNDTNNDNR